jgi:MerR family copper efflux transcriptional regulator
MGQAGSYDVHMADSFLRIGQLAERAGVSPDSIRHYERLGLLPRPERTSGGYRLFPPAAVDRVQLIRSAVRVGFSLRQLAAFLGERQAGGAPCRKVRDAAERILAGVDDQIAELNATKGALTAMVRDWDERLARTPPNQPARLLDAMGPAATRPVRATCPKVARASR